jgi:hypothetical protein
MRCIEDIQSQTAQCSEFEAVDVHKSLADELLLVLVFLFQTCKVASGTSPQKGAADLLILGAPEPLVLRASC